MNPWLKKIIVNRLMDDYSIHPLSISPSIIPWMRLKQCHKPSPSHHHKYIGGINWYGYHSQMGGLWHCFTHMTINGVSFKRVNGIQWLHWGLNAVQWCASMCSSCLKHLNSGGCHHFAMRKLQIDEIESRSRHVTIKLGVTWSSKALIYGIY